ncbi:hypothetical protein KUV50_03925 [Membranicola marinus]|uniref:Sporulation related domain-containing protein n=1 Tax=Membranihabitans marinus TaxID=1227546 RepID=A0A953HVF9_9BACT|nr:hypothetical protein [Membranihabitans marinus]MBY5957271.1 hypothetical protein [Membranihabitans marinus]
MVKIYKIITRCALVCAVCTFCIHLHSREVTLEVKALDSGASVSKAVIDLQSCHLGKFVTDERGEITIQIDESFSCVLYISASGYITLVRSFQIPSGTDNLVMVFYMQKQTQYKMGRILNAESYIPISNVRIIQRIDDDSEQMIGISDHNGQFGLMNHHSGEYHLIFKHPDYATQEKSIFVRRKDGQLGSFYLKGKKPSNVTVAEKSPKLIGIKSKKYSFKKDNERYIIVLGLFKGRENLPEHRTDLDYQFVEKGDWIRMYVGPFTNERTARNKLDEIKKTYPQAMLKSE